MLFIRGNADRALPVYPYHHVDQSGLLLTRSPWEDSRRLPSQEHPRGEGHNVSTTCEKESVMCSHAIPFSVTRLLLHRVALSFLLLSQTVPALADTVPSSLVVATFGRVYQYQ